LVVAAESDVNVVKRMAVTAIKGAFMAGGVELKQSFM